MNIKEKIVSLKLNIKQHRDQIKILLKEIVELEHYNENSNKNSNENSNENSNDIINNFCISNNNDIILSKNENLDKFI